MLSQNSHNPHVFDSLVSGKTVRMPMLSGVHSASCITTSAGFRRYTSDLRSKVIRNWRIEMCDGQAGYYEIAAQTIDIILKNNRGGLCNFDIKFESINRSKILE